MTVLCGSHTEVTWVKTGHRTNVYCRLDDAHTGDHEGRIDYAGALLSWPRNPTPIVIQLEGSAPPIDCPANPPNAACVCVIRIQEPTAWTREPRSILDDLRAGAEYFRGRQGSATKLPIVGLGDYPAAPDAPAPEWPPPFPSGKPGPVVE